METKTNEMRGIRLGAALIGLICAGTVGAQQQQLNAGSDRSSSRAQTASCATVDWAKDLLAIYPRIADGCQEVILVDNLKWARFDADYVRSDSRSNTVTLNFQNRQGRPMGDLILQPPAGQVAFIDGRSVPISDLRRGQQLNVYVPEGMFAAALVPGARPEQLAQIVREPITPAQANPAPADLLAQANPAPVRTTARRLPSTAGPLPLFALGGLMSLLGGLGLTIRRRLFARSA
jgi:hypothetical protein